MKRSSNVPTHTVKLGSGSAVKKSPLKDTLRSGNTSTGRK